MLRSARILPSTFRNLDLTKCVAQTRLNVASGWEPTLSRAGMTTTAPPELRYRGRVVAISRKAPAPKTATSLSASMGKTAIRTGSPVVALRLMMNPATMARMMKAIDAAIVLADEFREGANASATAIAPAGRDAGS